MSMLLVGIRMNTSNTSLYEKRRRCGNTRAADMILPTSILKLVSG